MRLVTACSPCSCLCPDCSIVPPLPPFYATALDNSHAGDLVDKRGDEASIQGRAHTIRVDVRELKPRALEVVTDSMMNRAGRLVDEATVDEAIMDEATSLDEATEQQWPR